MRSLHFVAVLAFLCVVQAFRQLPLLSNRMIVKKQSLKSINERIVNVDLGDRSYPIVIDEQLLTNSKTFEPFVKCKKALIVTNTKVGPLYSATLRQSLSQLGVEVFEVVLPDGEEYKNMDNLMKIMDAAIDHKLDRKSILVALGGGVVGDMCGFAAAIFQRGIRFIQVPTTVMAMVDSAVGGKTAVNHSRGKNMIGSFYQPEAVIVDTTSLRTLPDREYRSGLAEVIKYGLIKDGEFFSWFEQNVDKILARDVTAISYFIQKSCENKANVVASDEKESGVRATLNLGHTFGHAIEAGFGYGMWLHGEAVSAGTIMAADMSCRMGLIDQQLFERIKQLFVKCQLPISLDSNIIKEHVDVKEFEAKHKALTPEIFYDIMTIDKKVSDGQLNLVLLKGELGNCIITKKYDFPILQQTIRDYCHK